MKTYTLCVVKATRETIFVASGVDFEKAVAWGDDVYRMIRLLNEYMSSGVAVIVVADDDYKKFLTDRCSWAKLTAYQFGSY